MKPKNEILLCLLLFFCISATGQRTATKVFDINDYFWLSGAWSGTGFGGISEEIWSQPSPNGTMMGIYRHLNSNGATNFYEFMILDKAGIRFKHFNEDLTGWETKDTFITFKIIAFTPDKIVMDGLTYERKSDDELEVRLEITRGDKVDVEIFKLKRTRLESQN